MNGPIELKDMEKIPFVSIINDLYRFMHIPLSERGEHKRRKGRSLLEPMVLEACKHWDFTWAILNGDICKGQKVLDCGSGRGALQFYLSNLGLDVYSIDIQDTSSKLFRKIEHIGVKLKLPHDRIHKKLNRKYGANVKFFMESADRMHFEDETFDRIFSISVIEHMPDDIIVNSCKEMERVLKLGGLLLLSFDYHMQADGDAIGFTEKDFREKVLASFKAMEIVGNELVFNIPDWKNYLKDVNDFFQNENPNTSYGVVLRKQG